MPNTPTPTALITGASSGIGLHLAGEFAAHGHPLVLVAPVAEELQGAADDLSAKHGVPVRGIARDLREPDAAAEIAAELANEPIGILVNNAGHGQKGRAWEIPIEDDLSMIHLNVEAVVRLIKCFVPAMVARGSGRVLNTASVAGFEPGPNYATYSSTKAFVLSYSEALATELAGTGVTVTALCPGPTDTDFFEKADMLRTRAFQQANLMAPQDVARAAYAALMAGDRVIVPGLANKAMVFSRRFLPESAQAKMNEILTSDAPESAQKRERGARESEASSR